jgi:hypothetical protein
MSNEFSLVLGVIICALSVPSMISAFSSSRPPRAATMLFVIGGGLVAWAVVNQPGGYSFEELPVIFTRVLAQIIR